MGTESHDRMTRLQGSAPKRRCKYLVYEYTTPKRHHASFNMAPSPFAFRLPPIQAIAIPSSCIIIFFLGYSPQYLFYYIDPGRLSRNETIWFNGIVLAIWWCFDRAVTIDPGPRGWVRKVGGIMKNRDEDSGNDEKEGVKLRKGMRWCKKCEAVKPPRTHHCKQCGR